MSPNNNKLQNFSVTGKTIFTLSAPSGAGKTSLIRAICQQNPQIKTAISHTTRPKRANEINQKDYIFTSVNHFKKMIDQQQFLEYALVHGNYYGTSFESVNHIAQQNCHCILEIDWQGATQIKEKIPHTIQILIAPKNSNTLKQRLIKRNMDSEQTIEKRLMVAKQEIAHCALHDYIIINDDFEKSAQELQEIINSHNHKLSLTANQKKLESILSNWPNHTS